MTWTTWSQLEHCWCTDPCLPGGKQMHKFYKNRHQSLVPTWEVVKFSKGSKHSSDSLSLSFSPSLFLSLSLPLSFSLSLSLSHTHTHTHTFVHMPAHTWAYSININCAQYQMSKNKNGTGFGADHVWPCLSLGHTHTAGRVVPNARNTKRAWEITT